MIANPFTLHCIAIPPADDFVRGLFRQFGNGGDAEDLNCRTPLVSASDPTGPTVAYTASCAVSERVKDAVTSMVLPVGLHWIQCDTETGVIQASNHPAGIAAVGKVFDLQTALDTLGMVFPRLTP